jgi:hypothetical protein
LKTNFEKRIAALESRIQRNPVVIHLADGSQRIIRGSVKHYFALFQAAMQMHGDDTDYLPMPDHPLFPEIDAIKHSVKIDEPAQMFTLLWAMLQGGMPRGSVNT